MRERVHGLYITAHKGFQITFANGWTASVQWGPGNYKEGYLHNNEDWDAPRKSERYFSPNAEIAAFPQRASDDCCEWHKFDDGDTVQGYQTPEQVLEFLNLIAAKEKP